MSLRFPWTLLGPNACHLNYFILYCFQSFFDFMNLLFSPLLSPPPPLPSFLFLSIRLESGSRWELFQNRMDLNLRSSCLSFPERWHYRWKLLYLAGTFHFVHNLVMSFDTISLDICFDVTLGSFTMLQQKDCFLFFSFERLISYITFSYTYGKWMGWQNRWFVMAQMRPKQKICEYGWFLLRDSTIWLFAILKINFCTGD